MSGADVRADFIAGVTVALVLIPQAMAYAQLVGLPAHYGLYTAFLPGIVAALWGSSRQLASGPVAVVSLLTAAVLTPLATAGSEQFIAYAVLLSLLVGVFQLVLGAFKLGAVVSFISHPVIIGFTNAAAIIIAASQLGKLFGVPMGHGDNLSASVVGVLQQLDNAHGPTFAIGAIAVLLMWALKRYAPRLPGILLVVVIATVVSWAIGFERNTTARIEHIADPGSRTLAEEYVHAEARILDLNNQIVLGTQELKQLPQESADGRQVAALRYQIDLAKFERDNAEDANRKRSQSLRAFIFERVPGTGDEPAALYVAGQTPAGKPTDGYRWRIQEVAGGELHMAAGGEVVGVVSAGLPAIAPPRVNWDAVTTLLSGVLVIALVGFMEAVSMAKVIAAKTRDRLNPNQELIGQGLANVVGSFSLSYPVSGSFARSALNIDAGARSGLSSVFAGLIILIALLFLTPLFYHMPQAVLAATIMLAVINLIDARAIVHAWRTHRHDGVAAIVTFVATLAMAPHLDQGILMGAGLALVLYLYRSMKPRVAILARHADGTLRDVKVHNLRTSPHIIALRFDGSLYFANVPYFEDAVLNAAADSPRAQFVLVVGDGINELDASGDEMIHHLVERLRARGVTIVFSGLKKQVLDVMQRSGLYAVIGAGNFFRTEDLALEAIHRQIKDPAFDPRACPLMYPHVAPPA